MAIYNSAREKATLKVDLRFFSGNIETWYLNPKGGFMQPRDILYNSSIQSFTLVIHVYLLIVR